MSSLKKFATGESLFHSQRNTLKVAGTKKTKLKIRSADQNRRVDSPISRALREVWESVFRALKKLQTNGLYNTARCLRFLRTRRLIPIRMRPYLTPT